MTYRMLPHTADLKCALEADTLTGMYQAAVDFLRHVLVGESAVAEIETIAVPPDGDDDAERFFRFVRELLYEYDTERFLPARVVSMTPPTVAGERFDGSRHAYEHQVKAVTRHQYRFDAAADCYRAEMVLDL